MLIIVKSVLKAEITSKPVVPPLRSLGEVHSSVGTSQVSIWRRLFAFSGPAYLVSVGYMDPGNWATDLEGGARFGYQLLWVLVMSNAMAILLQTLSARLGIVRGLDLAQACRERYPRAVSLALWILCEIAIAACDLAEVLGAAIGLNLLFGLPLLAGVLLTAIDTLLLLWLQRFGIRAMEAFVLALIAIIGGCFFIEILLSKPVFSEVVTGLIPRLSGMEGLYAAIAILGATVMPHNLYLHSALVQTRQIGDSEESKRRACQYNLIDSAVALNAAHVRQHRDPDRLGRRLLQARSRGDRNPAGARAARAAARHQRRQRRLRPRADLLRTILDAHRHPCRPDRDGRFPEHPHEALAAAAADPHDGHHACGHRRLPLRRGRGPSSS